MSLYQHHAPQSYGHPYPPQATHSFMQQHAQPSVAPYAYSSYSMPPYEPGNFRRDYATRLSELTMNSKPIIQNLSMMAQNFTRFSDIVAECLQAHIRRVPAWMKLPAFYVLDAISKNVYEPYAAKFSAFVVPLFLETYGQVDPQTRSKMAEMLVTWRTGSPSGKELFGVAAQVSLERQIWGNDPSTNAEPSTRRHGQTAPLTKSQVLAELDVTLALKEQATHANPYDTTIANQVNVLHQLRRMVELGVSQEELQQILSQLRAMGRDNTAVPPPPPPQLIAPLPSVYNGPPIIPPPAQYVQSPTPLVPLSTYTAPAPVSQQPNITTTPVPSAVPNISGITSLFDSLVKAGLVSSSNTPLGAGTSTQTPPPASETLDEDKAKVQKKAEDERLEAQRKYAQEILSMNIRLTTADITRQRPKNVSTLYERLSIQCKQCASRFSDDSAGKKNLQDHLDMHFRHNRRMKEASGRGFSRSWFISVNDWISEPLTDVKGKGRELVLVGKNADATKEAAAKRDAEVRASVVVVPPGDEAKSISCPVCKEVLRSEFREEDEEWIWRNAVRVKDKIFHATCQAEMATSTTLAAKLRADDSAAAATARSRSRTPERTAPSTPTQAAKKAKLNLLSLDRTLVADASSVAGIKRKAQGDSQDTGSAETLVGSPPTKKVVLSAA